MSQYPKPQKRPINREIAPPARSAADDPAVWVQFVRASQGWTQEQLAEAAGMHPAQISAYETGRKIPRPSTRRQLAAAGTTPEAVLEAAEVLRRRSSGVGSPSISKRAGAIGEQARRTAEVALSRVGALLSPSRCGGRGEIESELQATARKGDRGGAEEGR